MTYFLLWELLRGGVDGLFEQHGARQRTTDFGQGETLGVRDHLIVLTKPKKKPDWMSPYEYGQAPAMLKVRELQAGGKTLVTAFVCPPKDPQERAQGPVSRRPDATRRVVSRLGRLTVLSRLSCAHPISPRLCRG